MPKKSFVALLVSIVLLTSCSNELPSEIKTSGDTCDFETEAKTEEIVKKTEENQITEETKESEEGVPPETTKPPVTTAHNHTFRVQSIRQARCNEKGERVWSCSCGEKKTEELPALSHQFTEASCTAASVCSLCGLQKSARLGHVLEGNTCTRCKKVFAAPINVLGKELLFDATRTEIERALGTPTEYIFEGEFVSLVYAQNPAELTVIQTDNVGLWGVFTMDPSAFFLLDGRQVSLSNFSGGRDLNSDAYYQDVGSCRIFGFKDNVGSKAFYGMWLRYSECRYDYMNDPALSGSFEGQSRLSWHYVNGLRAKNGLSLLAWSDAAAKVARDYSKVMVESGVFDHDGSFCDRLIAEGIRWLNAGENISRGYYNLYFVCDAYYNSESHRENILSEKFTHAGMGYYQTALQKDVFGAQIFYGL